MKKIWEGLRYYSRKIKNLYLISKEGG